MPRKNFARALPQWAILCSGFWKLVQRARETDTGAEKKPFAKIPLNFVSFIDAHFIGATVLISVGTVLGRMSAVQARGSAVRPHDSRSRLSRRGP